MKFFYRLAALLMVFALLFLAGCSEKEKELVQAVKNGETAKVQSLLDKGENPNLKADDGKTVLMLAAYLGHTEIAEALIKKGADVNAKDKDGNTALMYAAQKGNIEVAKLLLENGADINAVNKNGKTALQIAQENNQTKMVEFLKNWGKTAPIPAPAPAPAAPAPVASANKQLASIFFDFDKSHLRADQAGTMADNLATIKNNPKAYIIVGGHADEHGTREYNQALSEQRAKAIQKYLLDNGIAPERIIIYAFGKDHPLKKDHDAASWSYNRRVDILVSDTVLTKEQVLDKTIKQ